MAVDAQLNKEFDMKIVKAMKKIARLKGEIKEIKHRISRSLSTIKGNEFEDDFNTLMKLLEEKINEMMRLKLGVMKANIAGDMFKRILELGESKSKIDFLKELDPKIGIQQTDYSGEKTEYLSQISSISKNTLIKDCQDSINKLTDELDEFNAVTNIVE
jgi:hypothetical protein